MNEKIQAILLQLILALKNEKWSVAQDWQITLKSDGHVPLAKQIPVNGNMGDEEWRDDVAVSIDLKLASNDELTYFPEYTIYANISVPGATSKDIAYKLDADVAFTERDVRDHAKVTTAARKISRLVEDYIENEYSDYVDQNAADIQNYKESGGGKEVHPDE